MSRGSRGERRARSRRDGAPRERARGPRARAGRHRRGDEPLIELREHREPDAPPWWRRIPRPSPAALAGIAVLVLIAGAAVHLTGRGSVLPTAQDAGADPTTAVSASASGSPDSSSSSGQSPASASTPEPSPTAPAVPGDTAVREGTAAPGGTAGAGGEDAGSGQGAGRVVVYVSGAVEHPGIVDLPAGSRVAEALEEAGGATEEAELGSVNLARLLVDAEQIDVPAEGEAPTAEHSPAGGGGGGGTTNGSSGQDGSGGESAAEPGTGAAEGGAPVDINTADAAALDALPGVGPAIAQRILDHREQNGPFASVDALTEVSGIGPATLEKIRPMATV